MVDFLMAARRFRTLYLLLLAILPSAYAQTYSGMTVGLDGALNGFQPFPGSAWQQSVANATVDPNSAAWVTEVGGNSLHPDFDNAGAGIPYTVVDSSVTPLVPVPATVDPADSDLVLAPIPAGVTIESNPAQCMPLARDWNSINHDYHLIVIDKATGWDYEYYQALPCGSAYTATNGAIWDTTANGQRPWGMTSVDAAGLSVFAGLVKYDEAYNHTVQAALPDGTMVATLGHALRFTMSNMLCGHYPNGTYGDPDFVAPATHAACNNGGTHNIMGMRVRMKATTDVSTLTGASLVIAHTLMTYGMILADLGSNAFISGTSDSRWTTNDSNELKNYHLSDFEVITEGTVYTADTPPTGTAPTNTTPTVSSSTVLANGCVSLSWTSANSNYDYVQNGVPSRTGSETVCPTGPTQYTVQSNNTYGRASSAAAALTINTPAVTGGPVQGGGVQ